MEQMKRLLVWLYPIGWMGLIFYSSDQPYQKQDIKPFMDEYINLAFLEPVLNKMNFTYHNTEVSLEALGVKGIVEFFIRKGAHVTVFFVLTLLFYYAMKQTSQKNWAKLMLYAFIFTVIYAGLDEWHQGLTPNRTPYFGDVLLDTFGGLIAVLVIISFKKIKSIRQK
ncbi:VanZ family protein [Saliterribacillus persicus]|uniref:VanZ family protein n=1 Tax=Saliterribacillus persicus TaxID=930114 RepID=A0A368Y5Y2_9BACI|nr:VanZ family protein [Saliterribacillus persicus]RCW74738.1 VanZ family protein [Saliterribacillus persicus]